MADGLQVGDRVQAVVCYNYEKRHFGGTIHGFMPYGTICIIKQNDGQTSSLTAFTSDVTKLEKQK